MNILKQLKVQMGKELTSNNLRITKDQWTDKVRHKKVKLDKYIEKRKRKANNMLFQNIGRIPDPRRKCLRLRNSSNVSVVFGSKTKEHQICPEWTGSRDCLLGRSLL